MPGVKLTGFRGKAPKISPELLPDKGAQIARNCKITSGDLIPYPNTVANGTTGQTSTVRAIYPLRNPDTDAIVWMSWTNDVDVVSPSYSDYGDEQRFYYTGDGVPKVSTYELATSGSAPYPNDYYQLGLPLPELEPVAVASDFDKKSVNTFARDASNTVTIKTSSPHELRTGMNVTISGFTYLTVTYSRSGTTVTLTLAGHGIADGSSIYVTRTSGSITDGIYTVTSTTSSTIVYSENESGSTSGNARIDIQSFNTTASEVTVIDDYTFQYFSPGFEIEERAATEGSVDLSGQPILRTYVYTWMTPWGEESIGSEPSNDLIVREGQTITVSNLPSVKPTDPVKNFITGIRLYRTLASATTGDYFRLKTLWFPTATASVSRTTNVSRVELEKPHNFIEGDRFKLTGCTSATFNITGGIVTKLIDEYTFEYAQAGANISTTADTTGLLFHDAAEDEDDDARYWGDPSYDFVDDFDPVYLTEELNTDEYDAPPEDLQGLKVIQNNILCGFSGKRVLFSEPDNPHAWPTKYERTLDNNVVAVEPLSGIGMIVLTEGYPYLFSGSDPENMSVQRVDALYPCLSARSVVALNIGVAWVTHMGIALYSPSSGPRLITDGVYDQDNWSTDFDTTSFVSAYYEDAYFASHSTGSFVFRYEPQGGGQFVDCDISFDCVYNDKLSGDLFFCNDTTGTVYQWDDITQSNQTLEWKSKVVTTEDYTNLGAARVIADYDDSVDGYVTFKFWADKELVASYQITDNLPFRLPTGYRSDTFEFGVESDTRVRAIHLAETVYGLKNA